MLRKRIVAPGLSRVLLLLCLAFIPVIALGGTPAHPAMAGLPAGSTAQQDTRHDILVMQVYFRSTAERDSLANEFDAEEKITTGGFLTIWGNQDDFNTLVNRGLRVDIDQVATKQANDNTPAVGGAPNTFFGGYRTVEENFTYMQSLAAAYPTLAEVVDIGDSWCKTHVGQGLCTQPDIWNGYDMLVLHITNQAIPGPKPVFWLETGIHSREIAVPEMATRMMAYLLSGYNGLGGYDNDADVHWLVDYHDIWILPHVNPDGHHMSENGTGTPRLQRKNADRDDGCTAWPPGGNQLGTDNNRNFSFLWGCCGGSSTSPCNETYRGPSAGSEEETQAVMNKLSALVPDQRGPNITDAAPLDAMGVYQSMHTDAALNLFPWGFQVTPHAPNDADLRNIAKHMTAANAFPSGNGYTYGQPPEVLYSVDGDTADWGYGVLGMASYTTELNSGGSFTPPYSIIDSEWANNKGALLYQAKIARTPYLLTRGPDARTAVTTPMTVTQGTSSQLTANVNYAWSSNTYSQNILTAEYYVDTPPWAGGVAIPMTPTDGSYNSPTEAIQATIDTTSIPVGRHIIFVRGRGVQDYGGFGSWGPVMATWLTVTAGGTPVPTSTGTVILPSPTNTAVVPTATRTATATTVPPSPTSVASATCVPPGSTVDVSIEDFDFNPPTVTISVGATIRWTNNGSATHTSTSDTAVWNSGNLANGGVFSFTFNTPGVYAYHCAIHTFMTGTINVINGNTCATSTSGIPTATRTNTSVAASATRTATRTNTTVAATATRTNTSAPPTATRTGTIIITVVPTNTTGAATSTATNQAASPTAVSGTETATPEVTATACAITFSDVPADSTFYVYIRCLACRGIISGYDDGTFRPNNDITRGQIAKMVSNAAGFSDDPGPQVYEDVPTGSPFYDWINRLSNRGFMGGYECGLVPEEPCTPPDNRPYFRPNASATRGQLSKIVANAAGLSDTPTGQFYTDVPEGHVFYVWIMRLTTLGVMSGYDCGGVGEPCDSENRPYFRPFNNVTRGQASKIVANTFLPDCQTPSIR